MKLYDLLMARRSVRHFEDRPVPDSILDELLDAANNAPSGGNWSCPAFTDGSRLSVEPLRHTNSSRS